MNADNFPNLMQRLRDGSEGAARDLFDQYYPHVLLVIRRSLHRRLRTYFDSSDFAQDVFASFFAIPCERFTFENPNRLVAYLAAVAHHKVVDVLRQRLQTQKRNLNRESSLEGIESTFDPPSPEPTPSKFAIAAETLEQLAASQPSYGRPVLEMLRAGHNYQEIAEKLEINERTVRRLIQRLNRRALQ